jgi:hypothetical protein
MIAPELSETVRAGARAARESLPGWDDAAIAFAAELADVR